jgi:basic membrane protein A
VVYDSGGKFDKGFNESAYNGMEKFKQETGTSYLEFEVQTDAQREQAFERFAQKGADPIIGVGFSQEDAIKKIAPKFPKTRFVIIDSVIDLPNVQSIVFKEHEGSFLVGVLAAMASKTGKVGFVGGMDIPLIRRFECGYEQGVKYQNKDATVLQNMTGTTGAAWNDPTKGGELAKSQFDQGADVVFAAAGATSLGVYQAAKDSGKLAIGVDSNQNHLHPGTMLSSMMKRVDVAVHGAVTGWKGGVSELGLKEQGVDAAFDEYNKPLITDEMKAKVEAAKADIIAGKIKVHDYVADNACPAS